MEPYGYIATGGVQCGNYALVFARRQGYMRISLCTPYPLLAQVAPSRPFSNYKLIRLLSHNHRIMGNIVSLDPFSKVYIRV